jgi:uncharacterized phage-associated protein
MEMLKKMDVGYVKYSEDQLAKIGNSIVFLSDKIGPISKTKLLKILYLLDEISVKKSGIPFLNLHYSVWKFGPVDKDIFIELSSSPTLLKNYIKRTTRDGHTFIEAIAEFCDDEFSDNEMELLDFVVKKFGAYSSKDLVAYTHKIGSPWHNVATKNAIIGLLEAEKINSTELDIDLSELVSHDERKRQLFEAYQFSR